MPDNSDKDIYREFIDWLGKTWRSGDFDLFPAGGDQVSASITEIKSVKDIIEEMVS